MNLYRLTYGMSLLEHTKMNWYRLTYGMNGNLISCEKIQKPEAFVKNNGPGKIIELEAENEKDAKHRAYNFYCSQKKKNVRKRNHEAGFCVCSRKQDRINPANGKFFLTCSVCSERQGISSAKSIEKKRRGEPMNGERDELGRVEALKGRVRDRKNEIRLETLLEVRKAWEGSRTSGEFTRWLKEQINASLEPRKHADSPN